MSKSDVLSHIGIRTKPLAYKLGVETQQIRFVAAHAWDVAGAIRSGLKAGFIARGGKPLYLLSPLPSIVGSDLKEVVNEIIARDN